jgi:5-methylcytosine-specific restriction endonuclease McrA
MSMTPEEKRLRVVESSRRWRERNAEKRREIVKRSNDKRRLRRQELHQRKAFGVVIERERCLICGTTDGGPKGLVIHHKDGCNGKQGLPLNNDPENLVVVCRRCHPKLHSHGNLRQPEDVIAA